MPVTELSSDYKHLTKLAAKTLKGPKRRAFVTEVAEKLCQGNPRMTETVFGFGRQTVELGMNEKRTGLICFGNYELCGKKRAEEALPTLEKDIRCLAEPESQADPKLKNICNYSVPQQGGTALVLGSHGDKIERLLNPCNQLVLPRTRIPVSSAPSTSSLTRALAIASSVASN